MLTISDFQSVKDENTNITTYLYFKNEEYEIAIELLIYNQMYVGIYDLEGGLIEPKVEFPNKEKALEYANVLHEKYFSKNNGDK